MLFGALSMLMAADKLPSVSVTEKSKIGNITLEPGSYQIKVMGSIAMFIDASGKSYSAMAQIKHLTKKAIGTAQMGENVDGVYRITWITLDGTDVRLIF
jgi:hypothetical protein